MEIAVHGKEHPHWDRAVPATPTKATEPSGRFEVLKYYTIHFTGNRLTITLDPTSTVLTSSANPSISRQAVTFTASVMAIAPGTGVPTGTVIFLDGSTTLGTGTLNSSGLATLTTATLSVAYHTITANYATNGNYGSSSASLTQTVDFVQKITGGGTLSQRINFGFNVQPKQDDSIAQGFTGHLYLSTGMARRSFSENLTVIDGVADRFMHVHPNDPTSGTTRRSAADLLDQLELLGLARETWRRLPEASCASGTS